MDLVKLFGVMMLAVAAWMLARIVPERLALLLWAVPAFILAWLLWSPMRQRSPVVLGLRALGVVVALYGVALAAGAALGGTDPLAPLPAFAAKTHELPFRPIRSVAELDQAVAQARSQGRSVLVDFSADWCTSCKEMERYTFTDPAAGAEGHAAAARECHGEQCRGPALLKRFGYLRPPTIASTARMARSVPASGSWAT
jgi:thiol:disulfide interchange protein DsbD